MDKLTISTVAKQANVGIETIRYYQRIGLIAEPAKPVSGFRTYTAQDVQQVQFIKRAKTLGFSLLEIKTLLSLGEERCDQTKQLACDKLKEIEGKIDDLRAIADTLHTLVSACENVSPSSACPIIESIAQRK